MKPPGDRLHALAMKFCSAWALDRVVGPALADLRWEYREALEHHRIWRAWRVRATGSLTLLYLIAIHTSLVPRGHVTSATATIPLVSVLGRSAAFVVITTAGLIAVIASKTPFPIAQRPWLLLYLLPATLPVTVPFGFGVAISRIPGAHRESKVACRIAAVAAALSLLIFVNNGWIVPISNQAYREGAAGREVAKGFNELTFAETRSRLAEERSTGLTSHSSPLTIDVRDGEYSYHGRLAISVAPLVAGLFAAGLSARRRALRAVGITSMLLLYFVWYAALRSPVQTFTSLSPALVAWLPNLVLSAAASVLLTRAPVFRGPSASAKATADK